MQKREVNMNLNETIALLINLILTFALIAWIFKVILERKKISTKARMNEDLFSRFESPQALSEFLNSANGLEIIQSLRIESSSPLSGILLNIKIGIVLASLGLGLLIIGWLFPVQSRYFFAGGIVNLMLGIGFFASAWAAHKLGSKWNKEIMD